MKRGIATGTLCSLALLAAVTGCGSSSSDSSTQASSTPAASAPATSAPATSTPATSGATASTSSAPAATTKSYTMAEVAKHNSKSSCWAAINKDVYDLTSWIARHPGGPDKIEGICGKDGTSAFMGQHGNDTDPKKVLATFEIGKLAG